MKLILIILITFSSVVSFAANVFVVQGHGQEWGYLAIDAAKENAVQQAHAICDGEADIISEWDVKIVSRKEGVLHAIATAQFQCVSF